MKILKPTDMLKLKDQVIRYRAPGIVREALEKAAQREGINSSKLALYVMGQFLAMDVHMQKRFLEGELRAGIAHGKIVEGAKESSNK